MEYMSLRFADNFISLYSVPFDSKLVSQAKIAVPDRPEYTRAAPKETLTNQDFLPILLPDIIRI